MNYTLSLAFGALTEEEVVWTDPVIVLTRRCRDPGPSVKVRVPDHEIDDTAKAYIFCKTTWGNEVPNFEALNALIRKEPYPRGGVAWTRRSGIWWPGLHLWIATEFYRFYRGGCILRWHVLEISVIGMLQGLFATGLFMSFFGPKVYRLAKPAIFGLYTGLKSVSWGILGKAA